jgi:acetyltransferase-like isoleucine patch superfamily enzyme
MQRHQYPGVFTHETALVASSQIGAGTKIWAYCNLLEGSRVGRDCQICDRVFLEDGATLGNRVTVKCGVSIWKGISVEDDVFIGPGVMFTNDRFPRSRRHLAEHPQTVIGRYASLCAGAVLLPGIRVGSYALVGAGAVVTRDVPDFGLVYGNPARQHGWVCVCGARLDSAGPALVCQQACGRAYVLEANGPVLVQGNPDLWPEPNLK